MITLNTKSISPGKPARSLTAQQNAHKLMLDEAASCLLRELQKTLNIEQMLRQFLAITAKLIAPMNCNLNTGKEKFDVGDISKAHHKANYHLTLEGRHLGDIEFSRNKWFAEEDLTIIETLLGDLVYPLKNGLDYRDAINAAMSDALTGAANKRAFDYQLHHEFSISQRYGSSLSVAIFDIDFFKKVNDTYGHAAGDAVLKQVVEVVKHDCRESDQVFRLGGEEFGLLLTKTGSMGSYIIADRIRAVISKTTFCYSGQRIPVTVSIGVATYSKPESKVSFTGRADKALYAAKNGGRNKTILAENIADPEEQSTLENDQYAS